MVASEAILSPLTKWFGRAGGIWKRTLEKLYTRLLVPESTAFVLGGVPLVSLSLPALSSPDRSTSTGRLLPLQRPAVRCCHAAKSHSALPSSDVNGWECGSFFRTIPFPDSTGMRGHGRKVFFIFSGFGFVDFVKKCNFAIGLLNPALPCLWQEHIVSGYVSWRR